MHDYVGNILYMMPDLNPWHLEALEVCQPQYVSWKQEPKMLL